MAVSRFLLMTRLPKRPLGLSYFCFCSPVLGPGDRDGSQLQSLPGLGYSQPGVGEVCVCTCSFSEAVPTWGLSLGQLLLGL